jgi:hypothetical protein
MKKNEDAAARKKPKTSAAQIRVQKGKKYICGHAMKNISSTYNI